ncbi:MAG: HAD family phosphatase [Chloroflexi bacterium]|nr:HAD family phosphatase [Chloroflexota bacterium]
MPVRGVVFDIGGVLEYTPETGWIDKWNQRLTLKPDEIFQRLDAMGLDGSIGPCTEAEWLSGFREVSGLAQDQIDEFMNDLWTEYVGYPNTDLINYFRDLRPRYQTAILSNSFVGAREREQALYGFEDITDFIVYSHEVGMSKPDKHVYKLTCERLKLPPAEVIFVDDHIECVDGARAIGMHGVLFENNEQTIAELEQYLNAAE